MKVTVDKKELEAAMSAANRIIPKHGTIPAVSNVLLKTDGNMLTVAGTDLETSITVSIAAKVEKQGGVGLPSDLFFSYIKTLADGDVVVEENDKEGRVQVRQKRSKSNIVPMVFSDYPPLPEVSDDAASFVIDKAGLQQLISQVQIAAARDEARAVLRGCHMAIDGSSLVMAAADGFRLAIAKGAVAGDPIDLIDPVTAIIPRTSLMEVSRMLRGDGAVQVAIDRRKSRVFFDVEHGIGAGGKCQLVCQMLEGNFPDYEKLVPERFDSRLTFDVSDFQRATKTISGIARNNYHIIRMSLAKDEEGCKLVLNSWARDIGLFASAFSVEVEGKEDNRVGVNGTYIVDALAVLKSNGKAIVDMTMPDKPIVLRSPEDDQFTCVVMPMNISWLDLEGDDLKKEAGV